MTFNVYFYAEQAYLSHVKKVLTTDPVNYDHEIESGALCAISSAAAIEAIANALICEYIKLEKFDDLRIESKFEEIVKFGSGKIVWGVSPWQDVAELIRVRNWLVHFKNSNIGLLNSEGRWIKDEYNKIPKITPSIHLRREKTARYYQCIREASKILVLSCKKQLDEYNFLENEEYQPTLVG